MPHLFVFLPINARIQCAWIRLIIPGEVLSVYGQKYKSSHSPNKDLDFRDGRHISIVDIFIAVLCCTKLLWQYKTIHVIYKVVAFICNMNVRIWNQRRNDWRTVFDEVLISQRVNCKMRIRYVWPRSKM